MKRVFLTSILLLALSNHSYSKSERYPNGLSPQDIENGVLSSRYSFNPVEQNNLYVQILKEQRENPSSPHVRSLINAQRMHYPGFDTDLLYRHESLIGGYLYRIFFEWGTRGCYLVGDPQEKMEEASRCLREVSQCMEKTGSDQNKCHEKTKSCSFGGYNFQKKPYQISKKVCEKLYGRRL